MSVRHRCLPPLRDTGGRSLVDVRNNSDRKNSPWKESGPLKDSTTLGLAVRRHDATAYQSKKVSEEWGDLGVGALVSMRITGFAASGGPLAAGICNSILGELAKSKSVALATAIWEPDCTNGINNEVRVSFVLNKSTNKATWVEVYRAFGVDAFDDDVDGPITASNGVIVNVGGHKWRLKLIRQLEPVSRPGGWMPPATGPVLGSKEAIGMGDWVIEYVSTN